MRRIMVMAAIGALVVLAGCSSGGGSATETDSDKSASNGAAGNVGGGAGCGAVSQDEVATATGAEVYGSVELPTGCQWPVSADDPSVSYEWQAVPTESFAPNRQLAAETSGMGIEPIAGLGDDAFLRTQTTPAGDVLSGETWVTVGDNVFFVRSAGLPWSSDMAAAQEAIAELLVAQLG